MLVSARKFTELEVGDADLSAPEPVSEAPRPLTAAELLDAVALERAELPALSASTRRGRRRRPPHRLSDRASGAGRPPARRGGPARAAATLTA